MKATKAIRGLRLGEFYSEGCYVRSRYKNDISEWITIALLRTPKQAQKLAAELNSPIENIGDI